MRLIVSLLLTLIPTLVLAQANIIRPDVLETFSAPKNYVLNPSATRNSAGIATSSATLTRDLTAGNRIDGVSSWSCDTSANAGYCEWTTSTIKSPDDIGSCEASVWFKGDGTLYSVQILDGSSNLLNSTPLSNETTYKAAYVTYPCGSARKVRVTQTTAGTSPALSIGRVYYGRTTITAGVNQAQMFGKILWPTTTNCAWTVTNNGSSYQSFPADTDCGTPTVTANATAPATKVPGISFASLPAGEYLISVNANLANSTGGTAGDFTNYRVTDGTNVSSPAVVYSGAAGGIGDGSATFTLTVPSDLTNVTLQMQAFGTNTKVAQIYAGGTNSVLEMALYRYPSPGQIAVRVDQSNYDWVAYTPTLTGFGTATGIECFHKRVGSDLLVRCKFVVGTPTAVEARISFPGSLVSANTSKIPSIAKVGDFARSISASSQFSFHVLAEPSVSYFTLGIQGNANGGLTKALGNGILGTGETASFTARVPINGWTENQLAPLLVGSITSGTLGAERVERVNVPSICTVSPCGFDTTSSGWVSTVTRSGTGGYNVNWVAGTFSGTPVCVISASTGSGAVSSQSTGDFANSRINIQMYGTSGSPTDGGFNVICMGPR